jgi:hypothetical protein
VNARYFVTLFLLFASVGTGCASVPESDDAYLVHYFLDIKDERFYSTGPDGKPFYDELQAYKHREKTYLDLLERSKKRPADIEDVKRYLFLGYAAQSRNDGGMMEAFNSDLMAVFAANTKEVLSALTQIPSLQPSSCYYLGRYFGFEDRNTGGLDPFLERNRQALADALGAEKTGRCISIMEEVAR